MMRTAILGASLPSRRRLHGLRPGEARLRGGVDPTDRRHLDRRPGRLPGHRIAGAGHGDVDQGLPGHRLRLRPQQIEGPDWIGQPRFDVSATIPDGVPASQVPEMLQTLLAERFQTETAPRDQGAAGLRARASRRRARSSRSRRRIPNAPAAPAGTVNVTGGGNSAGVGVDMGGGRRSRWPTTSCRSARMTMAGRGRGADALRGSPGRRSDGRDRRPTTSRSI